MKTIDVTRSTVILDPDRTHVLARPFRLMSDQRSTKISARVMALPESEVHLLLAAVRAEFGDRQLKIDGFLRRRFDEVSPFLLNGQKLSEERKLLMGGYFTHEYSLEAAALFNPSMVPHPDQSDVPPGSLRFILSLRATAEGHVSSIAFRSGMLDANSNITMDVPSRYSLEPMQVPNSTFEKALFERKLQELRLMGDFNRQVLGSLPDAFTMEELRASIAIAVKQLPEGERETTKSVARETLMLAASNYEVQFAPESALSERVLFPVTPSQSNGIEDARFVLFHRDDGTQTYYATYTAYDGRMILPQFLETSDFLRFKFITLNGPAVENKGMALFPRKIGWPLCHARPAGRGKYLSDVLRPSPFLAFHAAHSGTRVSLGVHPVRQLRLAHRNRSRLARNQPRCGADAQVLYRRLPARSRRPYESHRPPASTTDQAKCE